ncbi:MipA/OmpV family protein [Sphingomonas sp. BK235]|uniref:MipA/OmpV family protein n=1 Tax=Sphingomonas sp. BK235 TaxID=2512131 RepID=UPI0010D5E82E|nr:MipA/OmpV family protein [Sphingomonas sp. BK235]TCP35550.1 outer membrane scaffolding protein for murein synthesis (MipA/OmpV family) [Sphingomonas sp. BK235]
MRVLHHAVLAVALAGGGLLAAPAALAQSVPAEPNPTPDPGAVGDTVTVALAGAYLPDYEGSNDYRLVPGPAAIGSIHNFSFTVLGNRASVDLLPNPTGPSWDIQAGPIGVINFNRSNDKAIDDRRVRALGERDTAVELGGYVGLGKTGVLTSPYDKLSASLSYRHDVSGVHRSGIWSPSVNYFTPLSLKAGVGLFASAERVERGFARTYFDVDAAGAAASGLPQFRTRGGWKHYTLGLAGTYSLTGNLLHGWKAIGGVTYKRMLNDFGDSPVVSVAGSRNQWLAALGIGYTF